MKKIKMFLLIGCLFFLTACTGKILIKNEGVAEQTKTVVTESEEVVLQQEGDITEANDNEANEEKIDKNNIKVSLKAIGDIMLARGVAYHTQGDYTMPFQETYEFLNDADITFANLECTLSTRGEQLVNKGIWLRAEPKAVEGIQFAGIDIVNIANNHILDYNEPAMMETIQVLDENNINHIGAGMNLSEARKPSIIEVKGIKVGFLGYTDLYQYGFGIPGKKELRYFEAKEDLSGVAPLKYELIEEDIKALRDQVDLLAVSLHWGVENSHQVPAEQRELAHKIMNAGADMILGHHPHVLQGIELYNGKPIVYSMANFIFDQNPRDNNESMIVDMAFTGNKLSKLEAIPLQIYKKKKTIYTKGEEAEHIMGYLKDLSGELDTQVRIEGEKMIFDIDFTNAQ